MRVLGKFPWTNTKKMRPKGEALSDEFFVLWLCKVTHTHTERDLTSQVVEAIS